MVPFLYGWPINEGIDMTHIKLWLVESGTQTGCFSPVPSTASLKPATDRAPICFHLLIFKQRGSNAGKALEPSSFLPNQEVQNAGHIANMFHPVLLF